MFRPAFFCVLFLLGLQGMLAGQQIPLSQARNLPEGTLVSVRGLVMNGPELGNIRFLQDGTAGIALFPGSGSQPGFAANVSRGDSLLVSGYLKIYNGLLEISPILSYEILLSNRPLPAPKPVSISQISDALEGQLISIECLSFSAAGAVFANSGTYSIADATGNTSTIYLASNHPLLGQPIPEEPKRITAILSQYGNFQLLPRGQADISQATCFYLVQAPEQSDIETTSFRLSWETNIPARALLRYGSSADNLDQSTFLSANDTSHSTALSGLEPGSIYWTQVLAFTNQDTVFAPVRPFATRSTSSGQIKVYFNQGIDLMAANGLVPDGDSYAAVLNEMLTRINAAQVSIDAAIYNNNRSDLTFALQQAMNRGVQVRYIAAESTANNALKPTAPFPVLYGNDAALMHNKFLVIDAGLADKAWVMSGSMNWTNGNMIQDYNNSLFIQDQALARTYELEFEEMWGTAGPLPDQANSHFGNKKEDNTPHQFIIGNRQVECYFSPSDRVTQQITSAIRNASYQASFAIFSFTKDEIGNALVSEHFSGTWVRGLVENINDQGAEFFWLLNNDVPVQDHPNFAQLHHKYIVLDAGHPMADPTVVTGSHNWTQAAESSNDENTLFIHDADIATLYQAEFERRWAETSTATLDLVGQAFELYPNPVRDRIFIRKSNGASWDGWLEVHDANGRLWMTHQHAGPAAVLDLEILPRGNYFISVKTKYGSAAIPIQAISR